jgi:hypothetical protein
MSHPQVDGFSIIARRELSPFVEMFDEGGIIG